MNKYERKMKKFESYMDEMRGAGCVVIAYTPEDLRNCITYHYAKSMTDPTFEFDARVSLLSVATDVHEDDVLWDSMSEAVAVAYRVLVEEADDYQRQQEREEANNG